MRRLVFPALICLLLLSGSSMAGDRGRPNVGIDLPPGKWWRMPDVAKELNISPDEQLKLDDFYYKHRTQMIDLKGNLEKEQIVLEQLIEKEVLDEAASKDQYQQVLRARNELSIERYNFLIELRKLLGYERFLQLKTQFRALRKEQDKKFNGREEPRDKGGRL
jgi:Spy/CpxP family protein refolding chaperone